MSSPFPAQVGGLDLKHLNTCHPETLCSRSLFPGTKNPASALNFEARGVHNVISEAIAEKVPMTIAAAILALAKDTKTERRQEHQEFERKDVGRIIRNDIEIVLCRIQVVLVVKFDTIC